MATNHTKSIGGKPPSARPPLRRIRSPFTDHLGQHSLSAYFYWGRLNTQPLPQPFFFPVYVTHLPRDNVTLTDNFARDFFNKVDGFELLRTRLDFFFLEGARVEECMQHWRGERAARMQKYEKEEDEDEEVRGSGDMGGQRQRQQPWQTKCLEGVAAPAAAADEQYPGGSGVVPTYCYNVAKYEGFFLFVSSSEWD